jgi:MFS family permease
MSGLGLSFSMKVLLVNNFGFNVGFYMLLPYLARHMMGDLGFSAGFAGFVMGMRVFSQLGLYLVGGTLADRFNYQSVILLGCSLRVVGFALFGFVSGQPGVACAAFLTGFAGALFSPACQALMARLTEGHPHREKIYALQNVSSQSGAFFGPLAGMALLGRGFRFLSFTSAGIFFLLLLLQWRYLPDTKGKDHASRQSFWMDWLSILRQKDFVIFCFIMSAYYLMFNQIYILLPLSVPNNGTVAAIFTLTAVLGILLQLPINHIMTHFFPRSARLGLGMGLMALSFPFLSANFGVVGEIPVAPLVTAAVLSLGMLIIFPTALSMVPELGHEQHQGICFGVFYFFAGMAGAWGGGAGAWFWEVSPILLLWGLTGTGTFFALLLWLHTKKMEREQTPHEAVSAGH